MNVTTHEGEAYYNALPTGYHLHEYRLERVLGVGGFGITYLAWDTNLDKKVAIKEYLPSDFAVRTGDVTVQPKSSADEEDYSWGLSRFLEEAQMLARFHHAHIVQVFRFFEANGTAYMVMNYEEGESFSAVMANRKGAFTERELLDLVLPLLDGLKAVHAAGVLHRDIKPGNIYIRNDGSPVLLDFGAARDQIGRKSRGLTSIVTPGYAPLEQYHADGRQGPWTDIYAMGAILYQAVSGSLPPEAPARVRADPYLAAAELARDRYHESFLQAIDWALRVGEDERPQAVGSWCDALSGVAPPVSAPASAQTAVEGGTIVVGRGPAPRSGAGGRDMRKSRTATWVAVAVTVLAVTGAGAWFALQPGGGANGRQAAGQAGSRTGPGQAGPAPQTASRPAKEPSSPAAGGNTSTEPAGTGDATTATAEPAPAKTTPPAAKPEPPPKPGPEPGANAGPVSQPNPAANSKAPAQTASLIPCPDLLPSLNQRLPAADCASVSGLLDRVLENEKTGQAGYWRSRDRFYSGSIVPVGTKIRPDGIPCRRFVQTLTVNGRTTQAQGTACRDRYKPDWRIVF